MIIPSDIWKKQRTLLKDEDEYIDAVTKDYEEIKPYIEGNVLDIGCGLGAVDVLIYQNTKNKLYLLDSDGDKNEYGFSEKPRFYNSLEDTRAMMEANGVDEYTLLDAQKDPFPTEIDTVISLLSWGFHYPLSEYWGKVMKLNPKRIILDVRKAQIPPEFMESEVIRKTCKYWRICL